MSKKRDSKSAIVKPRLQSLEIEEAIYMTNFNKKFPPAKLWERPDEKKVLAFIPGTIQKIMVSPGQSIEKGDPMVILEAMKMRNILKSGLKGVIKKIHVSVGEQIPNEHLIIEFE